MSVLSFLIPLCLFSSYFFVPISGESKFVVAGHIFCTTTGRGPNEPVNEAKVTLLEADNGNFPINSDDLVGETYSNAKGEFRVSGTAGELGEEELYLMVWHRCTKSASEFPPENEKCRFSVRIDLDQILNDDGPFEVNNLEIHLGRNIIAQSGNTTLTLEANWDAKCD